MKRQQAEELAAAILDLPRAGELQIAIHGGERLGTRFNGCAISQNVLRQQATLSLAARLERKKTTFTINRLDDFELIRKTIDRAFETCRHMPDDEELMPAPGIVIETPEHARSAAAESLEIETLGDWVAAACGDGAAAGIDLAGLLSLGRYYSAYADSNGGFAFERHHRLDYHVTATGANGSGWAEVQGTGASRDDIQRATLRAIDKCRMAQDPAVFQPRPVTVVLEPQAVGDLLSMAFFYGFDQRARDEGRSAFSDFDGRLGRLTLYSDPAHPAFPTPSFSDEGLPLGKSLWLDRGQLQQLRTSRYWAEKKELGVKPAPNNLVLDGDGNALEQLVADTDDGILVTRFWYIRATDSRTLGFTGMTRDGTYRIENGRVTGPVVDMRWNESVLRLLDNVTASGVPVATGEFKPMVMPALRVEDFRFSSLSGR